MNVPIQVLKVKRQIGYLHYFTCVAPVDQWMSNLQQTG